MRTIVKRSRWLRGGVLSTLRNGEGKQCCLGFTCRQAGISAFILLGVAMPRTLPEIYASESAETKAAEKLIRVGLLTKGWYDSKLALDAAAINDNPRITDAVREQRLKALFKRHGHSIVFKD